MLTPTAVVEPDLTQGTSTAAGLDDQAVRDRIAAGLVNRVRLQHSRTIAAIVRANVLTLFNAILGTLLVLAIVIGPLQDTAFGVILVVNTAVGVIQEVRAKRTLDRLAVLSSPRARVVRAAALRDVGIDEIVQDDILEIRMGDQVPVDGTIVASEGLELDESLLTGESAGLTKHVGDEVMSGSMVVAGTGRMRATKVGMACYARTLAYEASRYKVVPSELRAGINRILVFLSWAVIPLGAILVYSQLRVHPHVVDAIRSSIAGVVGMIPEGLVLLTNVAFAAAIVRLGRRNTLVQELPAVETLARIDVICCDKTGTITEGDAVVKEVEVLREGLDHAGALAAMAAADPHPNASLEAIRRAFAAPAIPAESADAVRKSVAFSSTRKWSGVTFAGRGTWVLGAPEILMNAMTAPGDTAARVGAYANAGFRVLLLARSATALSDETLPADLQPIALVVIEERIRADAADTIAFFVKQGVAVKVISGDNELTVSAVARRVGVPGADKPVDARTLSDDPHQLAQAMDDYAVFGRVKPHQKKAMVEALQARGHTVAMTGDGVNDVLALKDADIGIAMGSGSAASRAVAAIVLMDSAFATLPHAVAEGRRVIANIERVADLFLTKMVYAMLLAVAIAVGSQAFPFLNRHLTVVAALTIGIPGFFLAMAPSRRRARPGFLNRILRFAIPAGVMASIATFVAYEFALHQPGATLVEARTTATLVLVAIGLWVLSALARPFTRGRLALVAGLIAGAVLLVLVPPVRAFFSLELPASSTMLVAAVVVGVTVGVGEIVWEMRNRHPLHGTAAHALPAD